MTVVPAVAFASLADFNDKSFIELAHALFE
jgi:hypothetical protein